MSATQEETQSNIAREQGIPLERRIVEVKKKRSSAKGILTRNMNLINELTCDSKNVEKVKEKLDALPEYIKRFEEVHMELLSLLVDKEEYRNEEDYKDEIMTHVISLQEGIYNWLAQYEDDDKNQEQDEDGEVLGKPQEQLGISVKPQEQPREVEMPDGAAARSCSTIENNLKEENQNLEEELQELTKRTQQRQLELRNLMLKKERQKLIEEKKLQDELHSYRTVEHQLDTDGQGLTSHLIGSINAPRHPEVFSGIPQPQSTPAGMNKRPSTVSWEPSRVVPEEPAPEEPAVTAASILAEALKQVLHIKRSTAFSCRIPACSQR